MTTESEKAHSPGDWRTPDDLRAHIKLLTAFLVTVLSSGSSLTDEEKDGILDHVKVVTRAETREEFDEHDECWKEMLSMASVLSMVGGLEEEEGEPVGGH